jgi:glycosyltransferase involved in cell wall biosynthesis
MNREEKYFSVIVINYNGESFLRECIKSITDQLKGKDELILVDNNSNDNSRIIMEEEYKKNSNIHLFFLNQNLGISNSRNFGAKESKNNLLLFVDSDLILNKHSIENARNNMDEQTDVIIGEYFNVGSGYVWFREMQKNIFCKKRKKLKTSLVSNENFLTLSGGMCVVRKDVYLEFNGYSILFNNHSAEDIDFELRLLKFGKIIRLEKSFSGIHKKNYMSLKSLFESIKNSSKGVADLLKSAKTNQYIIPFNRYYPRIPLIHLILLCSLALLFIHVSIFFVSVFLVLCIYYLPIFFSKKIEWKYKCMSLYFLPITDTIWLYNFLLNMLKK